MHFMLISHRSKSFVLSISYHGKFRGQKSILLNYKRRFLLDAFKNKKCSTSFGIVYLITLTLGGDEIENIKKVLANFLLSRKKIPNLKKTFIVII